MPALRPPSGSWSQAGNWRWIFSSLLARLFDEQLQQFRIGHRQRRRVARGAGASTGGAAHAPVLPGSMASATIASGGGAMRTVARSWPGSRAGTVGTTCSGSRASTSRQACGVVEHVPGIAASRLQRLDVVLEADDGVGQPVEVCGRQRACRPAASRARSCAVMRSTTRPRAPCPASAGPALMPRISSGQLSKPAASSVPLTFCATALLDARQVDDAFAQHRALHLLEILRRAPRLRRRAGAGAAGSGRPAASSRWSSTWIRLAAICTSVGFVGAASRPATTASSRAMRVLHARAQLAEAEHAERVADLAQQLDLRRELLDLAAAAAHEHVEHVLDAWPGPRGSPPPRCASA